MKNLLEKLKENIKAELEKSAERHPHMVQSIYESLQDKNYYKDLTIDEVMTIYTFADVSLLQVSVWDLKYGSNLLKDS